MNTGTVLLSLIVLGGAGYGAYYVMNDPRFVANKYAPPDKWAPLRQRADGKRYIVYLEAYGPKGFDPMMPSMGVATDDMTKAQTALSRTADVFIEEAQDYASGKAGTADSFRGITGQQVGIYDIVQNRIMDKYDITTPKAPKRLRAR